MGQNYFNTLAGLFGQQQGGQMGLLGQLFGPTGGIEGATNDLYNLIQQDAESGGGLFGLFGGGS